MDAQNTPLAKKKVNKSLVFNVYSSNTKRTANSTTDNNKPVSKTNSVERSLIAFPSVVGCRLQIPKKYNNRSLKCYFTKK